ncbi:unnamed protein product [Miscanthus lutarioriparius]|uniref:Uncharacterized protein n=1 Tax=Miscanthus lutarioriparius TaxID=422564 RepID=A0A811S2R7_9POAL|nr:unnamed protein product [Miscanthus lutarioriparius]
MKLVLCFCICVVLVTASSPVQLSDSSPPLGRRWLRDEVIIANGPEGNTTTSASVWSEEAPGIPYDGSKRLSPGGPNPQHH